MYNGYKCLGVQECMECKYCGEKDGLRLMTRTQLVNGRGETIVVCLDCWWFKEIHGMKNGKLLSKLSEQRLSGKSGSLKESEPSPSAMGKKAG